MMYQQQLYSQQIAYQQQMYNQQVHPGQSGQVFQPGAQYAQGRGGGGGAAAAAPNQQQGQGQPGAQLAILYSQLRPEPCAADIPSHLQVKERGQQPRLVNGRNS